MTHASHSKLVPDLQREVDLLLHHTDRTKVMASLMDGSADLDLYVGFLVQTRHYVARTYPTLSESSKRLRHLKRHPVLADLIAQKADEEAGHEVLIDNDLRALGVDPKEALKTLANRWVKTYVAWSASMSNGQHPAGILGAAYVLECLSIHRAKPMSDGLTKKGSIPGIEDAVSFLDMHAVADIEHVADMDRLLVDIDDEDEIESIRFTAHMTRAAYVGALEEVAESLPRAA